MRQAEQHIDALYSRSQTMLREFAILRGIDFCSNDYLSFKSNVNVKNHLANFFAREEVFCSTGSRMVSGTSEALLSAEAEFAHWLNRENALFFANGYQANLSVISSVFAGCTIFSDEYNHASLVDGIKLSGSEKFIYRHRDYNHLEHLLQQASPKPRAIVTESVFSTSGAFADLSSLAFLSQKYDALLLVDEAHATGIFGKCGTGLLDKNTDDYVISTHSCGKALASFGAFVACSEKVAAIIKSTSRSFICTTAPPPYVVAHVRAMVQLAQQNCHRQKLFANMASCRGVLTTSSAIIAIVINSDERALHIKNILANNNFDVAVFRYPSVKKGHAQLRITLHSSNTVSQINELRWQLEKWL